MECLLEAVPALEVMQILLETRVLGVAFQHSPSGFALSFLVHPQVVRQRHLRTRKERRDRCVGDTPLADSVPLSGEQALDDLDSLEDRCRVLAACDECAPRAREQRSHGLDEEARTRAGDGVHGEECGAAAEVSEELDEDARLGDLLRLWGWRVGRHVRATICDRGDLVLRICGSDSREYGEIENNYLARGVDLRGVPLWLVFQVDFIALVR